MKAVAAFALLLSGTGAVLAQPSVPTAPAQPETVYSQAQREKDASAARWVVEDLLRDSFSLQGQYARWKQPICPHVYGLTPVAAWLIEHRIRQVAQQVGAPVDREDPCIPNIGIIFTADPQASLQSIATASPLLVQGGNQRMRVRYPVQAWYATFKTDFNGVRTADIPFDVSNPASDCIMAAGGACEMPWIRANDSRLHTGLTAEMGAATVLVDSKAVTGMTLGELGDYLAFLTLAQASQYGACQPLPTIANRMLRDCGPENTPHGLSHIDIALLTALYEVPDSREVLQKQRIVGAMRRSLEAQYGK